MLQSAALFAIKVCALIISEGPKGSDCASPYSHFKRRQGRSDHKAADCTWWGPNASHTGTRWGRRHMYWRTRAVCGRAINLRETTAPSFSRPMRLFISLFNSFLSQSFSAVYFCTLDQFRTMENVCAAFYFLYFFRSIRNTIWSTENMQHNIMLYFCSLLINI